VLSVAELVTTCTTDEPATYQLMKEVQWYPGCVY